jgi:cytochrome c-type biogenesis protein CcmH
MITFLLIALAMIAVAVLILIYPLRKQTPLNRGDLEENLQILRDQINQLKIDEQEGRINAQQAQAATLDIEKRVLLEESAINADLPPDQRGQANESSIASANGSVNLSVKTSRPWATALGIGIFVPIAGIVFYLMVGNPFVIETFKAPPQQMMTQQDIERMVQRLEDRLKETPNDLEGWKMLARSYSNLERLPEATTALGKALALAPNDPIVMVDYADLLAYQNQSAKGEPLKLVLKALTILPDNIKGLALAGTAYYEAKDFTQAQRYWARALALAEPGSPLANAMSDNIAAAKAAAAEGAAKP